MADPDVTLARLDLDARERFQTLRRELGVSSFGINLVTLHARQRGRVHAHERQEEVYVVRGGELPPAFDGGVERAVPAGPAARGGPATRRQLVNRGRDRVVVPALGGTGEHAGRDGRAWASWYEGGDGRPPQEVPLPEDLPG